MSCFHNRLSKPIETLIASRSFDRPPEKRPESNLSLLLDSAIRTIHFCLRAPLLRTGLYALIMVGAIYAPVTALDRQSLLDARAGTLKKLIVHEAPRNVSTLPMLTQDGQEDMLSNHFGSVLVVNFWATWCAPCRKEMPALDRLQELFPHEQVKVIAIATGRNEAAGITSFLESAGVDDLLIRLDPRLSLSTAMGVRGLPATILVNRNGKEVARLTGDAEWDSDSAQQIIRHLVNPDA